MRLSNLRGAWEFHLQTKSEEITQFYDKLQPFLVELNKKMLDHVAKHGLSSSTCFEFTILNEDPLSKLLHKNYIKDLVCDEFVGWDITLTEHSTSFGKDFHFVLQPNHEEFKKIRRG
jgi:hypothetical protein